MSHLTTQAVYHGVYTIGNKVCFWWQKFDADQECGLIFYLSLNMRI